MGRIIDGFYIAGKHHLDEKYYHETFKSLVSLPLADRPLGQIFYVKSDETRNGGSSLYIFRDGITDNDLKRINIYTVQWDEIEGKPTNLITLEQLNNAIDEALSNIVLDVDWGDISNKPNIVLQNDLVLYATKKYVDDAILNINSSNIDLTNYYTKIETDSLIELYLENYTITKDLSKICLSGKYDDLIDKPNLDIYLKTIDAEQLYSTKLELNNKVDKVEGKNLSSNDFSDELKQKLQGLTQYILPNATTSSLGGVIIGDSILIDVNGVIDVFWDKIKNKPTNLITNDNIDSYLNTKVDKENGKELSEVNFTKNYENKLNSLSNYTLPKSTNNILGGVIIGNGINIDNNGVISIDSVDLTNYATTQYVNNIFNSIEKYTLPKSTKDTLGGVIIGDGINIDNNGVISINEKNEIIYTNPIPIKYSVGGLSVGTTFEEGIDLIELLNKIFYGEPIEPDTWGVYFSKQYLDNNETTTPTQPQPIFDEIKKNADLVVDINELPITDYAFEITPIVTRVDIDVITSQIRNKHYQLPIIALPSNLNIVSCVDDTDNPMLDDYTLVKTIFTNNVGEEKEYNVWVGNIDVNKMQGAMRVLDNRTEREFKEVYLKNGKITIN